MVVFQLYETVVLAQKFLKKVSCSQVNIIH